MIQRRLKARKVDFDRLAKLTNNRIDYIRDIASARADNPSYKAVIDIENAIDKIDEEREGED